MVDIDYFKKFNDTYGHLAGDECLKAVSAILQDFAAQTGAAAIRFGGEEFLLVLMGQQLQNPLRLAKQIEETLRARQIPHSESPEQHVTVSIGLWHGKLSAVASISEAIRFSDAALYQAKESGRNRTVVSAQSMCDTTQQKSWKLNFL